MFKLKQAIESCRVLSEKYPAKLVRLYETPGGSFWIRFELAIADEVEGIELTHVCCYKNGVVVTGD